MPQQPNGYGSSTPNVQPVVRTGNTPVTDVDFGETLSQISGYVYADMDGDGVRDPAGENGVGPGVTVTLTGT